MAAWLVAFSFTKQTPMLGGVKKANYIIASCLMRRAMIQLQASYYIHNHSQLPQNLVASDNANTCS